MFVLGSTDKQPKKKLSLSKTSFNRPQSSSSGKPNPYNNLFNLPETKKSKRYSKIFKSQQKTFEEEPLKVKKQMKIIKKDKEQLYEENIAVKRQVNRLTEELAVLKGKVQASRIRNTRRTKHLQLQFQKELYWGGSKTHLISGIKYQYDKLKREYAQKCDQVAQLKRQHTKTKIPEMLMYIDVLEVENQRLSSKIARLQGKLRHNQPQQQKKSSEYMIFQMEEQQLKLEFQLKETKEKLEKALTDIEEKDKKIQFLQRLIKEKENKEFHANQRTRKIQKQRRLKSEEKQQLEEQFIMYQKKIEKNINLIKKQCREDIKNLEEAHQEEIKQKQKKIATLEHEVAFLEEKITSLQASPNTPIGTGLRDSKMTKSVQHYSFSDYVNSQAKNNQKEKLIEIIQEKEEILNISEKKTMQRADKKHSPQSKKVRKVDFTEIQHIAEFIKYKMIAHGIDKKASKDYFSFNEEEEILDEDPLWQRQYITMKETRMILASSPFSLSENDAFLLARYIIEDVNGDYVYCDEGNEQKRQLVKSIIGSLLGEYELCSRETLAEYNELIRRYETNIGSALRTICSSGYVSQKKFLQILNGLGIETTSSVKVYLVAKLTVKSTNLRELSFKEIFHES